MGACLDGAGGYRYEWMWVHLWATGLVWVSLGEAGGCVYVCKLTNPLLHVAARVYGILSLERKLELGQVFHMGGK